MKGKITTWDDEGEGMVGLTITLAANYFRLCSLV